MLDYHVQVFRIGIKLYYLDVYNLYSFHDQKHNENNVNLYCLPSSSPVCVSPSGPAGPANITNKTERCLNHCYKAWYVSLKLKELWVPWKYNVCKSCHSQSKTIHPDIDWGVSFLENILILIVCRTGILTTINGRAMREKLKIRTSTSND